MLSLPQIASVLHQAALQVKLLLVALLGMFDR
jgi:hypothetical protein